LLWTLRLGLRAALEAALAFNVALAIAKALMVAPERPVVTRVALKPAVIMALMARLMTGLVDRASRRLRHPVGMQARRLKAVVEQILALVVAEVVDSLTAGRALAIAVRLLARLLQLVAIGHDDTAVVFGVLEIVFRQYRIAGGLCVTRKREIFLGDMRWSTPYLHIGAVRFETARQRIVALAIAAATAAILLSLPHCLKGSHLVTVN